MHILKRNATTRTSHQGHTPRATQQTTSIVLGSGISGLAAAKVLSKYCRSVKVVDKDAVRSLSADSTAPDVSQVCSRVAGCAVPGHKQPSRTHCSAAATCCSFERSLQSKGARRGVAQVCTVDPNTGPTLVPAAWQQLQLQNQRHPLLTPIPSPAT